MLRGARAPFTLRRMASTPLLLASLLLAILLATAVTAALASFGARALPAAVHQRLAAARQTAITVTGQIGAARASADTAVIGSALRSAMPGVPLTLLTGRWSDQLQLPRPAGTAATSLIQAAALDRIAAHARLVAGRWPGPPEPGHPVPVAVPEGTAGLLGLRPGAVLPLRDSVTGAPVTLRVTGLFRPAGPGAAYWQLSLLGTAGRLVQGSYVTYGPLLVSPAALASGRLGVAEASWLALPSLGRVDPGSLSGLANRVAAAEARLGNDQSLGGLQVTARLPGLLRVLDSSVVAARSQLLIGLLQLLLIAAVAVALAARLLASQREPETALLAARGLARRQLAGPALGEACLLALAAAGAGALLGGYLAAMLLSASGLAAPGPWWPGSWPASVWVTAAAVAVLAVAVVLWPALRPAAPAAARARRGRQALAAGAVLAGLDVALLTLGVLAFWELRRYSAVATLAGGSLGIDPVLSAAPAVAVAGTALVPLRALPAAARALDRLSARGRRLSASLASWQVSRRPVRQGGPLLLVVLAVATGTLALAQHQSWRQSQLDRAAFQAGADVRADLPGPLPLGESGRIAALAGVRAATPVSSFSNGSSQVAAVDARTAAGTVLMRPDLAPAAPDRLWRLIRPAPPRPPLLLPGRPARLAITAALSSPPGLPAGGASVTLTVQDRSGVSYQVPAGRLPPDGRSHRLLAAMSATRQAAYPLRLLGLSLSYQLPGLAAPPHRGGTGPAARAGAGQARLTVSALAVSPAASGRFARPFASGAVLAAWRASAGSADLANPLAAGVAPRLTGWQASRGGATASFRAGTGQLVERPGAPPQPVSGTVSLTAPPAGPAVLPAIATRALLSATGARQGRTIPLQAGNATVPVRIVAVVRAFPTLGTGPAVIVDLAALEDRLAQAGQPPLAADQWLLRNAGPGVPRGLPSGTAAVSVAGAARRLLTDPLANVPQLSLLVITVAAAVLAAIGFSVSVAASVAERRTQAALLAALGVGRAGQAGQLCLEQLMLSLPAAGAGVAIGALLAHLLVPAVTLTSAAAVPFPPALVIVPLGWTAALALGVAAVPVLAAAATVGYRPDPAAQLRAAEAG
ncbi:MAG: FtsX-like permease family protein [Gemmatimonadota bacterium]